MRNMSFALTTAQVLARTKTVTRRDGWLFLRAGDRIQAVEKGMGLKKGETVNRLAVLRVTQVRREPLRALLAMPEYGRLEVEREGFGSWTVHEFVAFFLREHKGCGVDAEFTRIAFEYEGQEP
jgi:hypothetical protein